MIDLDKCSFSELVDWATGEVLQGLIAGKLRDSVWNVMDRALVWKEIQSKRRKK